MKIGIKRIFVDGYWKKMKKLDIYIYIVQNSKELFIDISERTKRYLK